MKEKENTQINKVLFLDCDGVINCEGTFKKNQESFTIIDQYMAFLVGKIVLDTDCKVVLSSSWRHMPEGVKEIEKHVVPIFDCTGNEPYDDNLPPGTGNCQRGREIKAWLDKHPEVRRYAILDDDSDMLKEQFPNFFKTTWLEGLTTEIAYKVIDHLNKKHENRKTS